MKRIGPTMRALRDVVSALPGCSKREALHAAGLPACGMGYTRPLDRAIAAGLIIAVPPESDKPCHPYKLFASERDRQIFGLRRELLASPSAERAGQIVAAIQALREEQAATWVG